MSSYKSIFVLLLGDLLGYIFSLIFTLTIRYGELPGRMLFLEHFYSFSILFVVFILVSFSAGLYDKQLFLRDRMQGLLIKVQLINFIIGIVFFYFAPVGISPKVNLFIYIIISTLLLFLWRVIMHPVVSIAKRQSAILVGEGEDIDDLYKEINHSNHYGIVFREKIAPQSSIELTVGSIADAVAKTEASILVVDLNNKNLELAMPFLYSLIFSGIQAIDAGRLYETIFDRIPMHVVKERWLVENASFILARRRMYDLMKRIMDIFIGVVLSIVPIILLPFVYIAIKIEDKGPLFVHQQRVGKNGKPVIITKFRSMTADDSGVYENGKTVNRVTKIGKIIRMTRIDELPQLWSVIKGEQSLIGPRAELPALVSIYEKEIPYYGIRHLIKPGLSGWAQIYHQAHPHHAVAVDDTRDKLSYDLFYIKNRSLGLDVRIAMQTVRALLSRQGV